MPTKGISYNTSDESTFYEGTRSRCYVYGLYGCVVRGWYVVYRCITRDRSYRLLHCPIGSTYGDGVSVHIICPSCLCTCLDGGGLLVASGYCLLRCAGHEECAEGCGGYGLYDAASSSCRYGWSAARPRRNKIFHRWREG